MKALVYYGPGILALEDVDRLSGDVIVEVREAGICGTDLKTFLRGHHLFTPPIVLGHECYGRICESCSPTFKNGDIVVIAPYLECGKCWHCAHNIKELCKHKICLDQGCFAEYVVLSREKAERLLFSAPMELEVLVLTEPLACVLTSVQRLGIVESALIVGGGPMGALFAAHFSHLDVKVQIVEPATWRANYLKKLGFDIISKHDIDRYYDVVVICVDIPSIAEEFSAFVADGGTLLLFGGFQEKTKIVLDAHQLHYREITVTGTTGYWSHMFVEAMKELIKYEKTFSSIVTHRFPLDKFAEAFRVLQARTGLKVVFTINV
ncbi:MAG: alcohol dehydrogenase catalytic domain-containing protein [Candidatus Bathyarchaeia archaeon]